WFNTLKNQPVSKRPNGLHPLQQRIWDRAQESRKTRLVEIRRGKFRQQAHRAALAHNVGVYRLQEKWEALAATQSELQKIIEHEARIALLKAQHESADRVAKAAEREAEAAEREARAAEREAEAAVAEKENPPKVEVVVVRDEPACPTPVVVPRDPGPTPTPWIPTRKLR
ncbi:MAG: hypothetical protein ACPG4K_11730, partial [Haloferula sp.]